MSIIFNIIESKSTVNVVNDFVRITVADGVSVDTVNSLIDDKLTKENIIGLKLADSPEFADELITPLALEATYTPTVWAYLVGIFTSVPKSVKAHLVKMWGNINDMAARVGILEDSYLLKYVVPVDTTAIDLTTDKYGNAFNFVEGDEIIIIIKNSFNIADRVVLRVNGITSSVYNRGGVISTSFSLINANRLNAYLTIKLNIINGDLSGLSTGNSDDNGLNQSTATVSLSTIGLNSSSISSIQLLTGLGNKFLQNSTIIIRKK